MAIQYEIRVMDETGTILHRFTDFRAFNYTKRVNEPGSLWFDVNINHAVVASMTGNLDYQVEIWRWDNAASISPYCDFYGLFRQEIQEMDSTGTTIFRAICPGQMSLLGRVIIAYRGSTEGRSLFTDVPYKAIMYRLVEYNATSAGTTGDGRHRDVDLIGISVPAYAYGSAVAESYRCENLNLLAILQELAPLADGDFDLTNTGGRTWQYNFYDGQLGTDRSASVVFSTGYGNMANPRYEDNKINERTVAIVAGPGAESDRTYYERTATFGNYDSGVNSHEIYVDGSGTESGDEANNLGDAVLYEAIQPATLTFDILQTEGSRYGREYFFGDLVTGLFNGASNTYQIKEVSVLMDASGREDLRIGTEIA